MAPRDTALLMSEVSPATEDTVPDELLEAFELNVRLVAEAVPPDGLVPCDTSDGCGQTCESACANSNG